MLTAAFAWLTSSIGKTVAKWVSFIAVADAVYWKIYADGQAAERAKQVAERMDAVRERERIQDAVRSCLMIVFVTSCLAGCATTADWCSVNRPIRPTAEDVATMSGGTARQLLEHNRIGQKACGWKP